jgi:hypothetical protein
VNPERISWIMILEHQGHFTYIPATYSSRGFPRLSYPQAIDTLKNMGESQLTTASAIFRLVAPGHARKLDIVAQFLIKNPELAPKPPKGSEFGSRDYWERLAEKFVKARSPRKPQEPSTIPDSLVSVILHEYFGFQKSELARIVREHSLAMASENIVGDLLERYIASKLEVFDWVWCSGEVIKKVDFLAARSGMVNQWIPLQIKNRDNSENSSSSSVRDGTTIVKWFRTFSRTGTTNWATFPESINSVKLSEEEFQRFARKYLQSLKD